MIINESLKMLQFFLTQVRASMCRQLEAVARGLGMESTKSSILPELVELAHDEEATVRIVGLETVVNILTASLFDEGLLLLLSILLILLMLLFLLLLLLLLLILLLLLLPFFLI